MAKEKVKTEVKKAAKSDPFKETIQSYLTERAAQDELFAVTLAKPNKNINDCVSYIFEQVKNSGRQGFNDAEIFNMAVHYYDEDDLKAGAKISGSVVVNHAVELTEADKEVAREKAIEHASAELRETMKQELAGKIELSDEDLADVKKKALDLAISEAKTNLGPKKKVSPETDKPKISQSSLF